MVTIDGRTLGCADVAAVARRSGHGETGRKPVTIADAGMTRAAAAHRAASTARGPIYGRTTGVGANGSVPIASGAGNGLRLIRSHASGGGEPVAGTPRSCTRT
jgi:histidine ammonia-lyase